eukprot:m.213879 g.213879  ORF g.213879 m.213879 type:complete len:136 (+) comp30279_c0_seq1:19-426(+)
MIRRALHPALQVQASWSVRSLLPTHAAAEPVDDAVLDRVCAAAMLRPSDAALRSGLRARIGRFLQFVQNVRSVPTANVEPLCTLAEPRQQLRADTALAAMDSTDAILSNAPEKVQSFLVAPKEQHFGESVVEQER